MNEEMRDILISKFIDSEITPAEQRLLDEELASNPESRQLLNDLQQIDDQAGQLIQDTLQLSTASPESHFQKACQKIPPSQSDRRRIGWRITTWAASLAACLAIAWTVWIMMADQKTPPANSEPTNPVVAQLDEPGIQPAVEPRFKPRWIRDITPNHRAYDIDWYTYTDQSGSEYLVEMYRDKNVTTASHNEGL